VLFGAVKERAARERWKRRRSRTIGDVEEDIVLYSIFNSKYSLPFS